MEIIKIDYRKNGKSKKCVLPANVKLNDVIPKIKTILRKKNKNDIITNVISRDPYKSE